MPTFLGEAVIQPTTLARPVDTVSLDAKSLRVAAWVGVIGVSILALRKYFMPSTGGEGDAVDELMQEVRAIERRNAARRAMKA